MIGHSIDALVRQALEEDLGPGDVTTTAVVPAEAAGRARILARSEGVLAGLHAAARVYALLDPRVRFAARLADGAPFPAGQEVAVVEGPARALLTGERTALNFLQHLSGIATRTARLVRMVEGTDAQIVDTRKTIPGLRLLAKQAVRAGGGRNHRFGLYDGILIKDNHLRAAGGIRTAVERARASVPHTLKVEVETETLDQVREALEAGADLLLLDNMDLPTLRAAVELCRGRALTEASGGITEETLRPVAETGVDLISIGALTHSVTAVDLAMEWD